MVPQASLYRTTISWQIPTDRKYTSRRQYRNIIVSHLRNRFTTADATARVNVWTHNRPISSQTVRNRLKEVGIRAGRPCQVFKLTARHRAARRWPTTHSGGMVKCLFVDETRIILQGNDGRSCVYYRRGERNARCCLVEVDQYHRWSIMICAGISMHTRTTLAQVDGNLNARKYQDDIIRPVLIPHIWRNCGMF